MAALIVPAARGTAAWAVPVGTLADTNGQVVAWGDNTWGQTDVPSGTYIAIDGGNEHALGIRTNGTVVGWGDNYYGQANAPAGTVTAVAAGVLHSLAIRTDGTLVGWGHNAYGQATVPTGKFTAISAGVVHSLGLRIDGTLAAWGANFRGQLSVPTGRFVTIAAGANHNLAIRTDGTLAGWGDNFNGQSTVPAGTFTAIAAGDDYSLAIRTDGTLAAWGDNRYGQTDVPAGTFTAIAAGAGHNVGLRPDGTLAAWGNNYYGQTVVPAGVYVAVAAGDYQSYAFRGRTEYDGDLLVSGAGAAASLNRSVTVAGNATLNSTMILYNHPTMTLGAPLNLAAGSGGGITGDGTINAAGLNVSRPATLSGHLVLTSSGPLTGTGDLTVDGTRLTASLAPVSPFTGSLTVLSGSVAFTGAGVLTPSSLATRDGGEVRLAAGQKILTGSGANAGSLQVIGNAAILGGTSEIEFTAPAVNAASTGSILASGDVTLRFDAGLTNHGSLALTFARAGLFGDIDNVPGGTISLSGNSNVFFADDLVNNGTISVADGSVAVFLGSLRGAGPITGTGKVDIAGDLRPGNSPAAVTYGGDLQLESSATLVMELAGDAPGAQYDQVNVAGTLSLAGALDVQLLDGFAPQAGQSFDLLNFSSLAGTFGSLSLPTLAPGLTWDTSALYSAGVLSVAAVPEPSLAVAWGAAALAGLLLRRDRVRRRAGRPA